MRSTFFDRPLEYQLLTAKEEWLQGEPIEGKLSIRNMNPENVIANTVDVLLAYGNFRKIKAGEENCWEVLHRENIQEDLSLDGNQQLSYDWRFNLPSDAPITDKSGSLFLLFGGEDVLNRGGQIGCSHKDDGVTAEFSPDLCYSISVRSEKRQIQRWMDRSAARSSNRKQGIFEFRACDVLP